MLVFPLTTYKVHPTPRERYNHANCFTLAVFVCPFNDRLMGHRSNIPLTCLSAPGGCTKNRYFICVPKIPLPHVLIHLSHTGIVIKNIFSDMPIVPFWVG